MAGQHAEAARLVASGAAVLGIELGSTRIKASLIAPDSTPLASGSHTWENRLEDGVWTYSVADVERGLAAAYASLVADVRARHSVDLREVAAMGVSAMMHGYVALDDQGELLVPFRTWRNNITGAASGLLTQALDFPVPQRWSVAHLYQSVLEDQPHLPRLAHLTTLAGYVHWRLTGERVLGVGDASGMFPIDAAEADWDAARLAAFDALVGPRGLPWTLRGVLPSVLRAGRPAGRLSTEGARLLDPTDTLRAGVPLCPPEGDAGTGMVATNAVRPRSGNVSAGTSVFAMVVLDGPLARLHPELDLVATPDGRPVAMAHSNNGSSDLDAWMGVFGEVARTLGHPANPDELYGRLMPLALAGDPDAGGLLSINYVSGEHRRVSRRAGPYSRAARQRVHAPEPRAGDALRLALRDAQRPRHPDPGRGRRDRGDPRSRRLLPGRRHRAAHHGGRTRRPGQPPGRRRRGRCLGYGPPCRLHAPRRPGPVPARLARRARRGHHRRRGRARPRRRHGFDAFYARHTRGLAVERAAVEALD